MTCQPFRIAYGWLDASLSWQLSAVHQFGGKHDAIALVLAVLLHVQIRDYQGLLSYVLFADLKHAFDVANKI